MAADRSDGVSRNALVILAVIAGGATLFLLHGILSPLALAVFLAIMIDGFSRVLRRRAPFLPRGAERPLAIVLSIALFGAAVFVIADNATGFVSQLDAYTPRLNGLLARAAAAFGAQVPPTIDQLFVRLDPAKYLADVARGLQGFTSNAIFIIIYLGFIIASERGFERKIVGLFPHRPERQEAVETFLRVRDGVEQYLWVQTVTGLILGFASWVAMAVVGLEDAMFWAFLIFIASYVPVLGGFIGILAPTVFALLQFDTLWQAATLLGVLYAVHLVVANVVLPRMQGRSLNIDPVVVLLALAFWGQIWGVAGMFLSTPLTVMIMVILSQFPGTRWVAVLLSADGDPDRSDTRQTAETRDVRDPAVK